MKTCCCTGHRPSGFPWDYNNTDCATYDEYIETMACNIDYAIRKEGVDYFITGGTIGVNIDFAEIVLQFRDNVYENIRLEIAVPFKGEELNWTEQDRERYLRILGKADKVTVLSDHYTKFCLQKRNEYMVDNSDIVFVFWNKDKTSGGTYTTIQYAKRENKIIELFVLNNFFA